jgi:hypothetical protein
MVVLESVKLALNVKVNKVCKWRCVMWQMMFVDGRRGDDPRRDDVSGAVRGMLTVGWTKAYYRRECYYTDGKHQALRVVCNE